MNLHLKLKQVWRSIWHTPLIRFGSILPMSLMLWISHEGLMLLTLAPNSRALSQAQDDLVTLVNFNGANGEAPYDPMVLGRDGNFYGTTQRGGASGNGTVYRLTPAGVLTTLVSFNGTTGRTPFGRLVQGLGNDNNFYGVTTSGGTSSFGTAYRVTPSGQLTILHNFGSTGSVATPYGLTLGTDGNFYGTALSVVGNSNTGGAIFRMSSSGVVTVLYPFPKVNNVYPSGNIPQGGLTQGNDGNFYGTTTRGGSNDGGTAFRITPAGQFTTLFNFDGLVTSGTNGSQPIAPLTLGSDGNLYGSTYTGGIDGVGTIFRMTPAGQLTTLASFDNFNGAYPNRPLVEDSNGNFWGVTLRGAFIHPAVELALCFG
jgi:uncharacterized repeat protein (TIGR03803 family)